MSQAFDEQELLDRVDSDTEFLAEAVQMLSDDGPALVRSIRASVDAGEADRVASAAHTLKGMVSNFCAATAQASAYEVERLAKGGDLAGAGAAVDAVDA